MPRSRRVATALLAVSLLLISACGARVPSKLRTEAANAALGNGGGGGGAGSGATGPGTGTGPGSATGPGGTGTGAAGTGGAAGPGATGTGTGTGTGSGTGTGLKANCSANNGGNTDVGVTGNSITVGNIADLTGPVPGLFKTAPDGVDAYFKYINSLGGICGRSLYVVSADSQTTCSADTNQHLNQVNSVFGWVGSFALYDDCGTDNVIKKHPTVPDLSYPLGTDTKANSTNNFPPEAAPLGYQDGMYCYWSQKYGAATQAVGSIYPTIPAAETSQNYFRNASEQCGWKWIYNQGERPTTTNFTLDIKRMQQKHVKLVYISAENAQNAATIKAEADGQGFYPIWVIPIAYASDFQSRLAAAGDPKSGTAQSEGIVGSNLYAMFFSPDDAKNIPEVGLFQKWMTATHPNDAFELYAMYSWCAARLFVQTLQAIGAHVTRSGFEAQIRKVHSYSCNGMLPTTDINNHKPSSSLNCYLLWHVHNGGYYREATPANRFRCDHTFVPYHQH